MKVQKRNENLIESRRSFAYLLFAFLFAGLFAVFVFAAPVTLQFVDPTPTGSVSGNSIYVNVSSSGSEHYTFVDFNRSLVLWASFDDANEDEIYDLSSYANNGRLQGSASVSLGGLYRARAIFDGVDDFVNFSDSTAIDSLSVTDRMTACAWINPYSTKNSWAGQSGHPASGHMGVLGQWWAAGQYNYANRSFGLIEGVSCGDGKYGFFVSPDGVSYSNACTNSVVPLNNWTHVCGTFNGSLVAMYVNGVLQSTTGTTTGIYNSPAPFTIGTYLYSYNTSMDSDINFNGSIDDVLLFNRALDLQEIKSLYNASANQYNRNFTSLANATYNVTAFAMNTGAERSSISRLIQTGVSGNITVPLNVSFASPTSSGSYVGSSIYVNLSASGESRIYSFVDFNRDLNLWMRFDERNSSVGIIDLSSYGNNGSVIGATVGTHYGRFGNGTHFGGNDYLEIANSSSFDSIGLNDRLSVCVWFNVSQHGTDYTGIVGRYNTYTSNGDRQFLIARNSTTNHYGFFLSNSGTTFDAVVFTNSTLNTGEWHHICGVYNGSVALMYLNGVLQSQSVSLAGLKDSVNSSILIGRFGRDNSFFNGSIDEVLIFNRALGVGEVGAIYDSSLYNFEKNYTGLSAGNYSFYGYVVNSSAHRLSVNRTVQLLGTPSEPTLSGGFVFPTPSNSTSGNSIYVNYSTSGPSKRYSFVDFERDLLLWIRMDNRNSSGGLTDLSSYSNNGSSFGGAVFNSTNGYFGEGGYFDGNDDRIIIPDNSVLDSPGVTGRMTLCTWFYVNNHKLGSNFIGLVGKWNSVGDKRQYLLAKNSADNKYGLLLSSNGLTHTTNGVAVLTNSALNTAQWYHMCGTFNGTTAELYLDGVKQSASGTLSGIYSGDDANLEIGTFNQVTTHTFNGRIDEVLLFNRSLSGSEIATLYNSSLRSFEKNYTSLAAGNHTFTGYGVSGSGEVVSESRTVESGSVSQDNFPSVSLLSPNEGQGFTSFVVDFVASASDDNQLRNVSLWGDWGGWHRESLNGSGLNGNYTFSVNLTSFGEGSYKWAIEAVDNSSQVYLTSNRTFNINVPDAIPEITLSMPLRQERGHGQLFKLNLTTSSSADMCWFTSDGGLTNTSMVNLGSNYFFYEDISAGRYNFTFYCSNSYGADSENATVELRRAVFFENQVFTNSQGLQIEFDFGFNTTSESSSLIIIPDSWYSEKDDTWLTQTELLYIGQGYAAAPINTRGKGGSQGTRDAFGWECLDIYEFAKHLEKTSPFKDVIVYDKYYISGASGAGGKVGVCSSKYPDFFVGAFSSVGVLNLTRWRTMPAPGSYYNDIAARVGCTEVQCPEAYLARDASFLVYNTQTPIMAVTNADDATVTVECSRDFNRSALNYNKTSLYKEFASGGHSIYRFTESFSWFLNYTQNVFIPVAGSLRLGGYVHTKNFSLFLNEVNVSHVAFLDYNLSGNDKTFNISTLGFNGTANLSVFDLMASQTYEVNYDSVSFYADSDSNGDFSTLINLTNYSSTFVTLSVAGPYCGDGTCNGIESCSSCSSDCGQCSSIGGNEGGSGGGGGGGGGAGVLPTKTPPGEDTPVRLEFSDLKPIILKRGTSGEVAFAVTNKDRNFLNNCRIVFLGEVREWFRNTEKFGIAPGERVSYDIDVNVPGEVEPGSYDAVIRVQCDEGRAEKDVKVVTYRRPFEVELGEYERDGSVLRIGYEIVEYSGEQHEVRITYTMSDFDGVVRYEGEEIVSVAPSETKIGKIEFELPKDSFGEFRFEVVVNDGLTEIVAEKNIFLPSQRGLTGLAISDENRRTLTYTGFGILVIFVLVAMFYLVRSFSRKVKKEEVLNSPHFGKKKVHRKLMEFEF